ncbi:MAG TPA: hypothetical protein VHO84_11845 [Syntrophorhabdaceae bacterium]|nr:hypothetical protein [Syntrophorhabdaceae bacterium]
MRERIEYCFTILIVLSICFGLSVLFGTTAKAQQKKVASIEGVKFDAAAPMADNVKGFIGRDVYLHLKSGKTFQGYVKSVSNGLVHLEKIAGREFYDVLISIPDISAVEAKFRDMK